MKRAVTPKFNKRMSRRLFSISIAILISSIGIIFLPKVGDIETTGIVLLMATFLFGIFVAFSMSDRLSRIERIREKDSQERSALESLHYTSVIFGKKIQNNITNTIDKYLMSVLDYKIWDYHKTIKEFKEIVRTVTSINIKTVKQSQAFPVMLNLLADLVRARKELITIIDDRLSFFQWFTTILLSSIILFSTFLTGGDKVFSIIFIILDSTVILLLLFLHTLDKLAWKEEIRIFEPYQRTFEAIGKLRYYPKNLIEQGRVRRYVDKPYRIASYPKPYPDMSGKKITIAYHKQ